VKLLLNSEKVLRKICPLKWNDQIPSGGSAMGIADIDFKGPEGLSSFITDHLDEFDNYQSHEGLPGALKSVRRFLQNKGIPDFGQMDIQVIPGTMLGIYTIMKWASEKEGDVVITNPIYPPIHFHATGEGNVIKWVGTDGDGRMNMDKLSEIVSSSTKLLAINNPNNPNGLVYKEAELKHIRDLAVDYDFTVFSDELYEPLNFQRNHISIGSLEGMQDRTLTLYGLSKAYGLAGYRSGFMSILHPDLIRIKEIVEHLLVSPSPFASLSLEYALDDPRAAEWREAFRNRMRENTSLAWEFFKNAGYECFKPEGNFFVFPKITEDDQKFTGELLKTGTQVVPGSLFGPEGTGHIRVNVATSKERVELGVKRIIEFAKEFNS